MNHTKKGIFLLLQQITKSFFLSFLLLLSCQQGLSAQATIEPSNTECYCDSISPKKEAKFVPDFKKPLPYPKLRYADISWDKRVWRSIDLKHPKNKHFVFEEMPFINLLLSFVKYHGETVRIFLEDDFTTPLTFNDLQSYLKTIDTIAVTDPITLEQEIQIVTNQFDWTSITHFKLKEDWVFDESTSRMHQRIIDIAPIQNIYDKHGNYRGQQALFWAYFEDFRPHFAKFTALYNWQNHLEYSWDDVFQLRFFDSQIAKDENYEITPILKTQKDKIVHSDRIKQEIFEKELNLWAY